MREPSTWRRDAPIVRSVASSRVRWAIVIERELAMTNAPTKSAIPPNARKNVRRNEMNSSVSAASVWACCAAVCTWVFGGRVLRIWAASCSSETPGLAATAISSSLPSLSKTLWAVGRSKPASVAPPIETDLKSTMPESRRYSTGPSAWMPTFFPIWRPWSSAVALSTTTSPLPGQFPWTRTSGLKRLSPLAMLNPRLGAPPLTIALPFLPMI